MKKGFFHVPGYFYLIFESKKKKRTVYLLVIYFFCLSLCHYYFRYLRSNSHIFILIINTLYHLHILPSNSLRKTNSFYLLQYVLSKQSL